MSMRETPRVVINRARRVETPAGPREFAFTQDQVRLSGASAALREYRQKAWEIFQATPMPDLKEEAWRRTDLKALARRMHSACPRPDAYLDLAGRSRAACSSRWLATSTVGRWCCWQAGQRSHLDPELVRAGCGFHRSAHCRAGASRAGRAPDGEGRAPWRRQIRRPGRRAGAEWRGAVCAARGDRGAAAAQPAVGAGRRTWRMSRTSWSGWKKALRSPMCTKSASPSRRRADPACRDRRDACWGGREPALCRAAILGRACLELHPRARRGGARRQPGLDLWRDRQPPDQEFLRDQTWLGRAHGQMSGFYFTDDDQHLDHDTQQNHLAPNTTSDLLFKGALHGPEPLGLAGDDLRGPRRAEDGRLPGQPQPGAQPQGARRLRSPGWKSWRTMCAARTARRLARSTRTRFSTCARAASRRRKPSA